MTGSRESLAQLQQRFHRLITQPRPIADAARALAHVDAGAHPVSRWVSETGKVDADERLAIYARSHFARMRDSLREDFPGVRRVLGDERFDALAADYIVACPSTAPSLHEFGATMPGFLREHAAGEARRDLPDLARLERVRGEVFAEASAPLLTEATLASLSPEAWTTLVLRATPACRLLELEHDVSALWSACDSGDAAPLPSPRWRRSTFVVWRRDLVVRHRLVTDDELPALRLLVAGVPFPELCEAFVDDESDLDGPALRAVVALRQWIVDELICAPS